LRDKITNLNHEIDLLAKQKSAGKKTQILENEIVHLRQ